VGEADGEGIRLVRGGVVTKPEEGTGHEGDLLFFCGAFSGGGFFHEFWGIFVDGEATSGGCEKGDSTSGSENDGGSGVLDVDDEFDGEGFGRVFGDKIGETVVNFDQTFLGWTGGWIFDGARGENERLFGRAFKDGVTGSPKGGVES
jgi:hypothetical protein